MMEDLFERIYEAMMGMAVNPNPPFPVENAFADGSECEKLYKELFELKIKVGDRLHSDDDSDVEQICENFWDIVDILCREMFTYGVQAGQMSQKS